VQHLNIHIHILQNVIPSYVVPFISKKSRCRMIPADSAYQFYHKKKAVRTGLHHFP